MAAGMAKESTQVKLARSAGGRFPDTEVLMEDREADWAVRGLGDWTQLHDGTDGWIGSVQLRSLPHGGSPHMVLVTKGTQAEPAVVSREKSASAIARLSLVATVVDFEMWWGWTTPNGSSYGPRAPQIGIDCAAPTGLANNRRYALVRLGRWTDEGGVWTNTNKIQVIDSDGLPKDLPGAPTYDAGFNEGKGNRHYMRMRSNALTGKYLGIAMGKQGYGCFDGGGNVFDPTGSGDPAPLAGFTAPPSTLAPFNNGLNATIDSLGRVESTRTRSELHVFATRLTKVS